MEDDFNLEWDEVFGEVLPESIDPTSALYTSLEKFGYVNINFIKDSLRLSLEETLKLFKGSIYQNPKTWNEDVTKGYETSDEYLSGNIYFKLREAKEANKKYNGRFKENEEALRRVLPKDVPEEIYVSLASPWITRDVIIDFLKENYHLYLKRKDLFYNELKSKWKIKIAYKTEFIKILEHTMNLEPVIIKKEVYNDKKGKNEKVIDFEATMLASKKRDEINETFSSWVWTDPRRAEKLKEIFMAYYGSIVSRKYNGSFLTLPNLDKRVQLYDYQKDSVARIIFSKNNTLLAHSVGAGKTYVMIAAGEEFKRMGIRKKIIYVVPNNILLQWNEIYKSMYPSASILVVGPKDFTPSLRLKTLNKMKSDEVSTILIAYSCFDSIMLSSKERYQNFINENKDIYYNYTRDKALNIPLTGFASFEKKLEYYENLKDDPNEVYFDDLNLDFLFLDEAHNYKNVFSNGNKRENSLVGTTASEKSKNMMAKVLYLERQKGGKAVCFATGTPITNSIADLFVMQKYLESGMLESYNLSKFEQWLGMFAKVQTEFEISADSSSYTMKDRYREFYNLPELANILSMIADFKKKTDVDVPKALKKDILVEPSLELEEYIKNLATRASEVKNHRVSLKDDNMLKITIDGRKAALDIRLVNNKFTYQKPQKLHYCTKIVYDIYKQNMDKLSTQIIFCDSNTPHFGFNVYDEIKKELMILGMKDSEIDYIHNAKSDKDREDMFNKMKKGEIRVLLGSTFKLGTGVNVQDKLIAVHHLDVPWRPSDIVQREGRIVRPGNTNKNVEIYRYITKGSFDAYSWQVLETKQTFISKLLEDSIVDRKASDVDSTILEYAEVKALALKNPELKERVEKTNELRRLLIEQRTRKEKKQELTLESNKVLAKLNNLKDEIKNVNDDKNYYKRFVKENSLIDCTASKDERTRLKKKLEEKIFDQKEEEFMGFYRGFEINIPNLSVNKKVLRIQRKGIYSLTLSDSVVGNVVRIENFLDDLSGYIDKLKEDERQLKIRLNLINLELVDTVDYKREIDRLRREIKEIDERLSKVNGKK